MARCHGAVFVLVFAAILFASFSRLSYLYTPSAPPPVPDYMALRSLDRPEAFHGCGHWQESYMDFHERTLAGTLPPRYLVSVAVEAGLADRLIGTISQFYLALLSERAFQITTAGQTLPPLEWAYDAPFINWTRADDPPILTDRLKFTYKGQRGYVGDRQYPPNDDVDTSKYWGMYLVNSDNANSFYEVSDLKGIPEGHEDAETVFITSNRGRVFRLFDNPHHKKQLNRMGLRPDTAFACAFRFLFELNAAVKADFAEETGRSSSTDDSVLKIALQMRTGDKYAFNPEQDQSNAERALKMAAGFVECAKDIAAAQQAPKTTKVLWYVASDSALLRAHLLREYGEDTVVTRLGGITHTDCSHATPGARCREEDLASALRSAAGTIWAMAMTDYQIVTVSSRFGRVAAWLTMGWHNLYEVFSNGARGRRCGPRDYELLELSAARLGGI
eukprot:TRINITY_DN7331_c0_g1_i1.p1 TRINITY_DN7331_c0_g1~~TRINITY_DN7331_c0_g1_i1.p1  ORF type:complete len:446 (+),score=61.44 TRINITY_DN7331_c0_g1_i1:44-1381(+)